MIDFSRITGFDWDAGNARKSEVKHSVSQAEAEQVFFHEPLLIVEDEKHSKKETRFHALGSSGEGRLLHVAFTLRVNGTKLRVISSRDMSRKERRIYEQET